MTSSGRALQLAHFKFFRQEFCTGRTMSCRFLSSGKKKTVVPDLENIRQEGTTSLIFPWMNKPFGKFPKDSSFPHPGCGPIARRLSLGTISYLCTLFGQKAFSPSKFAKEASDKIQILTKAIDDRQVETIFTVCNDGIGSLLGTAITAMPKQGVTVKLELMDVPKVTVAGCSILAFNTLEDPRTLLLSGPDSARMKTRTISPPFMPYLQVVIQQGRSKNLKDARAMVFRVHVHIETKEVFYCADKEGNVFTGSKDVRESSHVISFQSIFRPEPQLMKGSGFYDDQGWKVADIDLIMLKSNYLKQLNK